MIALFERLATLLLEIFEPFDPYPVSHRITLSTSSAATAAPLRNIKHVVALDRTGGLCWCEWVSSSNGSATLPATGQSRTGFWVRDGDTIEPPGQKHLAGILTGTATTGELGVTPQRDR